MTERKIDNSLYTHLRSVISRAMPLEYGIRAVRLSNPLVLQKLRAVNGRIRQYWIGLGASDDEIDKEDLMDFAWDTLQVGFPLTRRHGRMYGNREFLDLIHEGLAGVRNEFAADVAELAIAATRYFRICDLLSENDILQMLSSVARCLQDAQAYEVHDEIELAKFVRKVREPIHLHPALRYAADGHEENGRTVESFGFLLDTEMEFSIVELKRQIGEFLYQYAVRRQSLRPAFSPDPTADALIGEFLREDMRVPDGEKPVTRLDGFISILSGLYCWDRYHWYRQHEKSAMERAIADTQAIYPKQVRSVGYDTIRKNYNTARVAINSVDFSL